MTTITKMPLVAWNKDTAFIKLVHDALIAAGLVQTSDTGQINVNSITAYNSTAATSYGYLVYRFGDSIHATAPVYMRITWETGTTTNSVGVIPKIQVGTGTDGAGTLTGTTTTAAPATAAATTTTADGTAFDCWVGGDESLLLMVLGPLTTSANYGRTLFMCERLVDENGVPDGTAAKFHLFSTTTTSGMSTIYGRVLPPSGSIQTIGNNPYWFPSVLMGSASIAGTDGRVPISPVGFWTPAGMRFSRGLVGVPQLDLPLLAEFDVHHLGETRRYVSMGANAQSTGMGFGGASQANGSLAVLAA